MPNELNNSYDLLGSAVALVASIGRLRAPHFACAPKTSPKLLYQSWRCFGRDDSVPRFRPGKATTFFLVFIQDWMHRQRWGTLFPVCAIVNSEPSLPELPCPWLGEWVRLVPFQSGSNIFPSVYPLRVRQCEACSVYFRPTKVALPPHALQVCDRSAW
jgi:hypothetical protein